MQTTKFMSANFQKLFHPGLESAEKFFNINDEGGLYFNTKIRAFIQNLSLKTFLIYTLIYG